jgi:transposase
MLFGFLGVTPSERTSDARRRQGSITKAGPQHARGLLVEAATTTAIHQGSARTSPAAKPGKTPRVIAIAWRAQSRLYQRWQHMHRQRRKPAAVVAIACARELASFLWEAATLE